MKQKKVILVHGYNKGQSDMRVLKENLEKLGYRGILVDLPLTFKRIKHCTSVFKQEVEKIIDNLAKDEKIALVGHSTGGLIIRNFLSNTQYGAKIDRCVLIATPNQGSKLADIISELLNKFTDIFKTLDSLQSDNVQTLDLETGGGLK